MKNEPQVSKSLTQPSLGVLLIFGDKFHEVAHLAIEKLAKLVNVARGRDRQHWPKCGDTTHIEKSLPGSCRSNQYHTSVSIDGIGFKSSFMTSTVRVQCPISESLGVPRLDPRYLC